MCQNWREILTSLTEGSTSRRSSLCAPRNNAFVFTTTVSKQSKLWLPREKTYGQHTLHSEHISAQHSKGGQSWGRETEPELDDSPGWDISCLVALLITITSHGRLTFQGQHTNSTNGVMGRLLISTALFTVEVSTSVYRISVRLLIITMSKKGTLRCLQ